MTTATLDLTADTIDVRDIIARVEELENEPVIFSDESDDDARTTAWRAANPDDAAEFVTLRDILAELAGNCGGDEQWRGDWYPITLIRDAYFPYYAREMLEDCGTIPGDLPSWLVIDWDATAHHVRGDYARVEIDGVTYWYR